MTFSERAVEAAAEALSKLPIRDNIARGGELDRLRLSEAAKAALTAALAVDGLALQGWRTIDSAPQDRPIALLSIQPQQNGGYHITMDVCQWRDGIFEIGYNFRTGVGHGCATHWCEIDDLRLPPLTAASDGEVG